MGTSLFLRVYLLSVQAAFLSQAVHPFLRQESPPADQVNRIKETGSPPVPYTTIDHNAGKGHIGCFKPAGPSHRKCNIKAQPRLRQDHFANTKNDRRKVKTYRRTGRQGEIQPAGIAIFCVRDAGMRRTRMRFGLNRFCRNAIDGPAADSKKCDGARPRIMNLPGNALAQQPAHILLDPVFSGAYKKLRRLIQNFSIGSSIGFEF